MTIDLHLDTLWQMTKGFHPGASHIIHNTGGLQAGVFALYLRQDLLPNATHLIQEQLEFFREQEWGEFKPYLAMENGALLQGDLNNLDKYAQAGIKYLTLTHNYDNELGGSATDITGIGILPFGREVIKRCNELGVLVDVSHASDQTAYQAIFASKAPVIASHSGCRKLLDHPRNLTDGLIKEIARTGGLIGVPFVKKFAGTRQGIADHIDHIVQLVGIDHVAIGSDIDGAVLVDGAGIFNWHDVISYPLLKRGYTFANVDSIVAGGNWQRLLEVTNAVESR